VVDADQTELVPLAVIEELENAANATSTCPTGLVLHAAGPAPGLIAMIDWRLIAGPAPMASS
jgi:hypothetical protein